MARGQRKKAPGTKPMSSFLQKYYTGTYWAQASKTVLVKQ